ncbi:MAG TPA: hypothetical protein VKY15_00195 [Acidimicrobiales bacterium]|nr:hypothetical protein [Acidimicrobiales bacterium]
MGGSAEAKRAAPFHALALAGSLLVLADLFLPWYGAALVSGDGTVLSTARASGLQAPSAGWGFAMLGAASALACLATAGLAHPGAGRRVPGHLALEAAAAWALLGAALAKVAGHHHFLGVGSYLGLLLAGLLAGAGCLGAAWLRLPRPGGHPA